MAARISTVQILNEPLPKGEKVRPLKRLHDTGLCRKSTLVLVLTSGCAQLLELPQDPEVVHTGPWRCLANAGQDEEPELEASEEFTGATDRTQANLTIDVCDFVAGCPTAVTELVANVCDKRDIGCQQPLQTGIMDAAGRLRIQVPTERGGFDGYVAIQPPAVSCADTETFGPGALAFCALAPNCEVASNDPLESEEDRLARLLKEPGCFIPTHAPGMLFLNPPVTADQEQPIIVPLFKTRDLSTILGSGGATVDPSRGNLFITTLDCDGKSIAGVTYELPEFPNAASPIYARDGVPSSGILQTDSSGIGGFVGVPNGFVEVRAFTSDGQLLGELGMQSAPFTISYSTITPLPSL